jgi:hypothetical protein
MRRLALPLLATLAACATAPESQNPLASSLVTAPFTLASALAARPELAAVGALVYVVTDPLGPGWRVEGYSVDAQHYRFILRRKRFSSGGDGEAAAVFRQHAEKLARLNGYARYLTLEFTEGVDSSAFPLAQRVATGLVEFQ